MKSIKAHREVLLGIAAVFFIVVIGAVFAWGISRITDAVRTAVVPAAAPPESPLFNLSGAEELGFGVLPADSASTSEAE